MVFKKILLSYNDEESAWLELIEKHHEPEAKFLYILVPCIIYTQRQ